MAQTRILIIDDDEQLSQTLARLLHSTGRFATEIVNNPLQAREHALRFRPDLILLDVIMPYKDGGTVAMELREESSLKNVSVIFLTSILDQEEAAARGNTLGNDPVLPKPVTISRLLEEIDRVLADNND